MGLRLNISALFGGKKLTYCQQFYEWINTGRNKDRIYGFPYTLGAWCNSRLKVNALQSIGREDNIREIILPRSEKENEAGRERERERERERDSRRQVQTDSQCRECLGAIQDSKRKPSDNSILGFPIVRGQWCNSNLKLNCLRISNLNRQRELVYPTQTEGFPNAPLNKAQRKILFSTSELPLTNQKELSDTQFQVRYCHL